MGEGKEGREGKKMLVRVCQMCGRLVPQGQRCECQKGRHKEYDKRRRDKQSAAFYHSLQWVRLQQAIKARAGGCDEYIKATEGRLVPANTVHHIEPVRDAPGKRLDADNLILVSPKTHRMIHDHYAMGETERTAMQDRLRAAVVKVGGGHRWTW